LDAGDEFFVADFLSPHPVTVRHEIFITVVSSSSHHYYGTTFRTGLAGDGLPAGTTGFLPLDFSREWFSRSSAHQGAISTPSVVRSIVLGRRDDELRLAFRISGAPG
jgi:hypothetical protein